METIQLIYTYQAWPSVSKASKTGGLLKFHEIIQNLRNGIGEGGVNKFTGTSASKQRGCRYSSTNSNCEA